MISRKAANLENAFKIFLKCNLWSIAAKLENVGTAMFLQVYKILSNFDSNPLICDPTLFPGKNSPNIAKNNRVLPGKGRGDKALILTYLDSPMVEVFLHYYLSSSISAIFRGNGWSKLDQKFKLWVRLFFFFFFLIWKFFIYFLK